MSARGTHRRTSRAWAALREQLYRAQSGVLELEQQLTAQRQLLADEQLLRAQADAMVAGLVTRAEGAESRAAVAEDALAIERERKRQAAELITGLRDRLRAPQSSTASDKTQEILRPVVVPLGSPTWQTAQAS